MNIIGIDPSLISTGMCINGKVYNYCRENEATLSKGGLSKWFKLCENMVELRWIYYRDFDNYSDGELTKLKDYDRITDQILKDIEKEINKEKRTIVGIEGYNFGAQVGDLIDLVTFSTLLRKKIYDYISKEIIVYSPSSLKQESCKLTYEPIDVGKKKQKLEWRNNFGVSGGNFTKREMFLSIVENNNFSDYWASHCKSVKEEILSNKTIKKPYEDVNDAYLIYQIIKKQYSICSYNQI